MNSTNEKIFNSVSDSGAMLELSKLLNSSLDLNFILGNILLSSMGKFLIARGLVFIHSELQKNFEIRIVKGLSKTFLYQNFDLQFCWNSFSTLSEIKKKINDEDVQWILFCEENQIDALIPLILDKELIGIIGLGKKLTGQPFREEEKAFLESLANIAASAVHTALTVEKLQQTNRQLDTKIQEMNTLFEFGREVNTTFDEQKILRLLSYALMGQLRITRYVIYLRREDAMEPVFYKIPSLKKNKQLQKKLSDLVHPLIFTVGQEPSTALEQWLCGQGLCVIIPMRSQNETRGVMCLGEKFGGIQLEKMETEYLSALANVAISALENARLVQQTLEKQRLEKEISIAREIQLGLLPKKIPTLEGYDIAGVNISSQQIGGDYYDFIQLNKHEYAIAIADVSGKGIPASLLMANVQAALRVLAPLRLSLSETTSRMNTIINHNTSPDKFITFFWGILNDESHSFRFVNAGHNPPYLFHTDSTFTELVDGGLILGILPDVPPYKEGQITIHQGDCIVLYTDGVSEAMNKEMIEFGEKHLIETLQNHIDQTANEIIEHVHSTIKRHVNDASQSDDITMVVIKRIS